LEVCNAAVASASKFSVTLHRGEREAIALAESLRSDVLLIDEQIDEQTGRAVALSRNLPTSWGF
jgi:predicted nucleic acid-binding protein